MPGEAFYWILNMSVTASLAGAVLLALRKIKKLPRRLIFLLWAIPFLRMWMPVSIGSRYGLMGFLARAGVRTVTVYERAEPLTMMNCVGAAESYFPVVYKINVLENLFRGAFFVWLIVCVTLFGILIFLYVDGKKKACQGEVLTHGHSVDGRLVWQKETCVGEALAHGHSVDGRLVRQRETCVGEALTHGHSGDRRFVWQRKVRREEGTPLPGGGTADGTDRSCRSGRFRETIRLSGEVASPAVYGIFHPQIVIPESYRDKDLTYILAHENVHIRRLDNVWRLAAAATACLHWFNPLAWLFLKLFLEDMELACDEQALAGLGEKEKKAYALALVECAADRSLFASAFGGANLHKRVRRILSYKKISFFSALCFAALAAGIACALLTNGV